jgi:hypothetical protein
MRPVCYRMGNKRDIRVEGCGARGAWVTYTVRFGPHARRTPLTWSICYRAGAATAPPAPPLLRTPPPPPEGSPSPAGAEALSKGPRSGYPFRPRDPIDLPRRPAPTPAPRPVSVSARIAEATWIWKDGALVPWKEATVHLLSTAVQFGSSVFEGIRCYETPAGPAIFRLREHLERLMDSATIYRMRPEWTVDALVEGSRELIRANALGPATCAPWSSGGTGPPGSTRWTPPSRPTWRPGPGAPTWGPRRWRRGWTSAPRRGPGRPPTPSRWRRRRRGTTTPPSS